MKCAACGYEGEFDHIGFITKDLTDDQWQVIDIIFDLLSACPECKTVRIEEEKSE